MDERQHMKFVSRFNTAATAGLQSLHVLMCIANYIGNVRYQAEDGIITAHAGNLYLAFTLLGFLSFLILTSVLYLWAYRLPFAHSSRRRQYGVISNLLLSDAPLFGIDLHLAWTAGTSSSLQAASLTISALSVAVSGIRTWVYMMMLMITAAKPPGGGHDGGYGQYMNYQPQAPPVQTPAQAPLNSPAHHLAQLQHSQGTISTAQPGPHMMGGMSHRGSIGVDPRFPTGSFPPQLQFATQPQSGSAGSFPHFGYQSAAGRGSFRGSSTYLLPPQQVVATRVTPDGMRSPAVTVSRVLR
eukprot:Hpha_TRINITY_DN32590_c0_g1::TRINITY_DN32590_c0_g1_i1::g.24386::m.24386